MLVNTFGKKISASLVVKNSEFYIEVAKFVQAYTVILNNPNDFLIEIGENSIDEKKDKITWDMLSRIMQKCDFGFSQIPTNSDLLVFYNYALEIGSISKKDKRVASVDDISDAQKIYYNFVDEAKEKAESEYLKQHRIAKIREKEVNAIESKLSSLNFQKWFAFSLMIVTVIFFCLGVAGCFFSHPLVELIGSIIPIWNRQYIGSIILIIISILLFYVFDKWQIKSKQEFLKLDHASQTIFSRNNDNFVAEQVLKYKLDLLKKDLEIIQNELNDENKTFDVKNNIEKLIETNEYYKKYFKEFQSQGYSAESKIRQTFDGYKSFESNQLLNEEQFEVAPQQIILEGQFDETAYNEKFEKSKKVSKKVKQKENIEKEQESINEIQESSLNEIEIVDEEELTNNEQYNEKNIEKEEITKKQREIEKDEVKINEKALDEQLQEYVNYIEQILG